jgi:serine/threonine protein kinase
MIANKYSILEKIGNGKFGTVYKGEHIHSKQSVAIKMETINNTYNTLKHETTVLNYLYHCGCRSLPSVLYYGIVSQNSCLIMDFYKQSLEDYMKTQRKPEQINTIMSRAIQILGEIHAHKIVHRDIKPANFMLHESQLYLIDFGMASVCENTSSFGPGLGEPCRNLVGSPKYASFFVHEGHEYEKRDDLISLGYCYLYFVNGALPWSDTVSVENSTDIVHPENQRRKYHKQWSQLGEYCKPRENIYLFMEYCYHAKKIDHELLSQIFAPLPK